MKIKNSYSKVDSIELVKPNKDIDRLAIQEQRLIDAYREGIITQADLKDQKGKIAAKYKVLEAKKKAAPRQQESVGQPEITRDELRGTFQSIFTLFCERLIFQHEKSLLIS